MMKVKQNKKVVDQLKLYHKDLKVKKVDYVVILWVKELIFHQELLYLLIHH